MTDEIKPVKPFKYEFLPSKCYPMSASVGGAIIRISHDHKRNLETKYEVNQIRIERVVKDKRKAFDYCITLPITMTPEEWANIFSKVNVILKKND